MSFTLDDLLDGVRASRRHFWKHLRGLSEEQWNWKPYPGCKSVRETLAHLIWVDRSALVSLETGKEPDHAALEEPERDGERLRALLEESHERLVRFIAGRWADAALDTEVCLFGSASKLGRAVAYLTAEDFYHSGQVAFIRMATDPGWDYYGSIYAEDG
jgi:uncharacterized damage-inducible protein DinB